MYDRKCNKCSGELVADSGDMAITFDTLPASYPVECKACGHKQYARRRSEAGLFVKKKDKTKAT